MISALFIYFLFGTMCLLAICRPWVGVVGFYSWVCLEPQWNFFWAIPAGSLPQKYILISLAFGILLNGGHFASVSRTAKNSIIAILAYLLIAYISAAQSIAPELSSFYLGIMWKLIIVSIVAILLLDSQAKVSTCLLCCTFAQGYNAYRINLDYLEIGYCRYAREGWGSMGDNNLYSNLTLPLLAVSFCYVACGKNKWLKLLCGITATLQTHQIMLMESRGAMLGGAVLLALFCRFVPKTKANNIFLFIGLLIGATLAGPPVVREFKSIFAAAEDRDSSAESRLHLWKAGWQITKDYPLLGVGPYAGQRMVPRYYEGSQAVDKGLHNLFLEISTGVGVLGAIAYFYFFAASLLQIYRNHLKIRHEYADENFIELALMTGIPAYIVGSAFSSGALAETSYILAACTCAYASVKTLEKQRFQLETFKYKFVTSGKHEQ